VDKDDACSPAHEDDMQVLLRRDMASKGLPSAKIAKYVQIDEQSRPQLLFRGVIARAFPRIVTRLWMLRVGTKPVWVVASALVVDITYVVSK